MLIRLTILITLIFVTFSDVSAQEATEEPVVFTGPKYEHIPDPNHPVLEMLRTIPHGDYPLVLYGDMELAQLARGDSQYHNLQEVLPLAGQASLSEFDEVIWLSSRQKVTQVVGLFASAMQNTSDVLFDNDLYLAATQAILAQESGNAIRQMLFMPASHINSVDGVDETTLAPFELLAVADTVLTNERTTITYVVLVYDNEADALKASETILARWSSPDVVSDVMGADFTTAWDVRGVLRVASRNHYDPATEKYIALITLTHPLRRNNASINLEIGDLERGDEIPEGYEFLPSGYIFRTFYEMLMTGDTSWLVSTQS